MNATLDMTTEATLDVIDLTVEQDRYATTPMFTIRALPLLDDEESLHTSFEDAISERLVALHNRLSRLNSIVVRQPITDQLEPIAITAPRHKATHQLSWRRKVICCCLPIIFTLVGFDLMGLMVLHMH